MRTSILTLPLLVLAAVAVRAEELQFETHIRPILKTHCFQCHGDEEKHEGRLDLRLVRLMAKGGDSGPVIVSGKSSDSLMAKRIAADEMPPGKKKLTAAEKATLSAWIDQGAKTARPEPETIASDSQWTDEERGYWAFQPVRRPAMPVVQRPDLIGMPIDAFLLSKLEQNGLTFSSLTDRRKLARRLSFDLLGLPPTPERVEAFAADPSPDAYARLVDEFLASPHYGERWARHWLDVAGYADSDGYTENDRERPWAYRYRDYVIRSLNDDKPLDQFIIEQLAGDELLAQPYANLSPEDADKLTATGFLRMAPDGTGEGGVDQNVARNDVVAETIKIVSTSLLGMTVGCAQCHNHRYDPISQVDYYRFRAIFEPGFDTKNWRNPPARLVNMWSPAEHEQAAKVAAELGEIEKTHNAELDAIVSEIFEKEIAKLGAAGQQTLAREAKAAAADKRTPEQVQILKDHPSLNVDRGSAYLYEPKRLDDHKKKFEQLRAEANKKRPADSFVACLNEVPQQVPPTHVFFRGDINQQRQAVEPGDLSVLGPLAASIGSKDPQLPTTGRRLALARHLTNGKHPLLARVLVNRVWMNHFGRGLVASPGDFGILGERPSHRELLDYLADELVRSGWQLKHLQRQIVLSTAYQQSSQRSDAQNKIDPDNRLLGRMSVRRLEAEAIRDAILEVSGNRSDRMLGPSSTVNPDEVGQVIIGKATRDGNGILVAKPDTGEDQYRRSVYVQVRRSMLLGMLEPFDVASTAPNCERRTSSTVPPQSLLMMNHEIVLAQSQRFAQRVAAEVGDDIAAQVRRAWQLAYGQPPSKADMSAALAVIEGQRQYFEPLYAAAKEKPALNPSQQALAVFCQALLSSNRFLYVD
jgi:hypothetical protein